MLCPGCRCQVTSKDALCRTCGRVLRAEQPPLELVLQDGTRIPADMELTIGRAAGNGLRLEDPSVSRVHVRIRPLPDGGATVEDAGSSHGTLLDGKPLTTPTALADGSVVQIGESRLRVELRRSEAEAGRTIIMRPGASLFLPAVGKATSDRPVTATSHPRVRSGWALKRLDASEGERRFVLRNLNEDDMLRMGAIEAELFQLLDGSRTIPDLVGIAEQRFGHAGPAALARVLADLSDHGMLVGVEGRQKSEPVKESLLRRLFKGRSYPITRATGWVTRLYRAGGWILFTTVAKAILAAIVVAGIASFAYLVIGRYGTPFVVAKKAGLGGAVFILGRLTVAAIHETAHALCVASFGRKVGAFGIKLVLIFPYVYVDTTEAWFESRRRRLAVSAAGPISDLSFGGLVSLAALLAPAGTLRDVFFQLALGSYIGAFFNLNPLLDRDGYAMLVDGFGEPGLRRRSRERVMAMLAGRGADIPASRAVTIYGVAAMVWSFAGIGFAAIMSRRYFPLVEAQVHSAGIARAIFAALFGLMLLPIGFSVVRPLMLRRRRVPEIADG